MCVCVCVCVSVRMCVSVQCMTEQCVSGEAAGNVWKLPCFYELVVHHLVPPYLYIYIVFVCFKWF